MTGLAGIAAPFDTVAVGTRRPELLRRGAFAGALAHGAPVPLLLAHDPLRPLATTADGTLRVWEGERGLLFEADLPDTPTAANTAAAVRDGRLAHVSFGFAPLAEQARRGIRELQAVALYEITLTDAPLYPRTEVKVRNDVPRHAVLSA